MKSTFIHCCVVLFAIAISAWAQDMVPPTQGPKVMVLSGAPTADGRTFTTEFSYREVMRGGEFVKNAPYTATAVTETTQVLADGTRIVNTSSAFLARDGEGRTRREETLSNVGPLPVTAAKLVFINDPVAKSEYVLNLQDQTAQVVRHDTANVIGLEEKKKFLAEQKSMNAKSGAEKVAQAKAVEAKQESLGTEVIDGVSCDHLLQTQTIPAGKIGNDRPIVITSETWAAPELHLLVMRKRSDPRFGETVYKLTNITRGDPDPTLFQVPGSFKVLDTMKPLRSPLE